jgi:hypothetical protein
MIDLYTTFGVHPSAQPTNLGRLGQSGGGRNAITRSLSRVGNRLRWMWRAFLATFRRRR